MVGVHFNPKSVKTHPNGDTGVYGLSISNNLNGWITKAGLTTYKAERKINPGDKVTMILDCYNSKISYIHNEWEAVIEDLPKNVAFYPYFDPYDLDFTLLK